MPVELGTPPASTMFGFADDEAPSRSRPFVLRHLPALDGLRGLAVAGVLVFHGGYLTGGYLGVDLFFVLSGFLITALLLRERAETDHIDLRHFWIRRARRLLPAVFAVVAGVAVYSAIWARPSERTGLRDDALATLAYVANWRAVLGQNGYWDLFDTPSLLEHTWSLAIEEQFYGLWPLVVVGLAALATRRRRPLGVVVAAVAGAGAVASWSVMALAHDPAADPSRLYFGTDTRAGSILAGAALAAVLTTVGWGRAPGDRRWRGQPGRCALEAAAVGAMAMLGLLWATLEGRSSVLYQGGFVLCALGVVTVIAAAAHPDRGPVAAALSWRPLRGLGLISYGLYLWHWPVFVVVQQHRDELGLTGPALLALKLAVSLAVAVVSYRVVEQPIRRHGLRAWGRRGRALLPAAAVAAVALMLVTTMALPNEPPGQQTAAVPIDALPLAPDDLDGAPPPVPQPPPSAVPGAGAGVPVSTAPLLARAEGRPTRVLVVGDSVAVDLGLGLDALTTEELQVGNVAIPGCAPTRAVERWRVGTTPVAESEDCRNSFGRWTQAVDRFKPDAVLVHFAGGLHGEIQLGEGWYTPCSAEFGAYLYGELEAALPVFTARGATVVLAPPTFHVSPFFDESYNDNAACVAAEYRRLAAAHTDSVRLLALDRWICPRQRECRREIDGVRLREDGVHFHGAGRDLVTAWIAEQLFGPAPVRGR